MLIICYNITMFEKDLTATHFKQPDIFKEEGEFKRVAETFGIDSSVLIYKAQQGQMRILNETDWSTLENTDSSDIETGDWQPSSTTPSTLDVTGKPLKQP